MFTYKQSNGILAHDAVTLGMGYSGFGEGKNNPDFEWEVNVGPIPRGDWTFVGTPFDDDEHGPFCIHIEPKEGTNTFGRDEFLLHGDSKVHPGMASKGCIIQLHITRLDVWNIIQQTSDRDLRVV